MCIMFVTSEHLIFWLLPEHPNYGGNFVLMRYSLRFKGVKINVFFVNFVLLVVEELFNIEINRGLDIFIHWWF